MKVYISGKISGLPYEEALEKFRKAEEFLKTIPEVTEVVNPMTLVPFDTKLTWEDYMVEDLRALFSCDAIYMLDGWIFSRGAKIEKAVAETDGKLTLFEFMSASLC